MADTDSSQTVRPVPSPAAQPVQVVAVTSGKGGVGKTNVAANIAVAVARQRRDVLLLDADLGLANVDVLLGLTPRYHLGHVLSGEATLEDAVIYGPGGIRIVPAASGEKSMLDLDAFQHAAVIRAFEEMTRQPDVMIVDTAAGISADVVQFLRASDQIVVVVCDEPASMTDAYAIIKVMSTIHGVRRFQIVTNMTRSAAEGRTLFQKLTSVSDRYLDVVLHHLGNVPYDAKLRRAVQQQRAVVECEPDCWSARAFRNIAERICAWPAPDADHGGGGLSFFLQNMLSGEARSTESEA